MKWKKGPDPIVLKITKRCYLDFLEHPNKSYMYECNYLEPDLPDQRRMYMEEEIEPIKES